MWLFSAYIIKSKSKSSSISELLKSFAKQVSAEWLIAPAISIKSGHKDFYILLLTKVNFSLVFKENIFF